MGRRRDNSDDDSGDDDGDDDSINISNRVVDNGGGELDINSGSAITC